MPIKFSMFGSFMFVFMSSLIVLTCLKVFKLFTWNLYFKFIWLRRSLTLLLQLSIHIDWCRIYAVCLDLTHSLLMHIYDVSSNKIDLQRIFLTVSSCNSITWLRILVCFKGLISSTPVYRGGVIGAYRVRNQEEHSAKV